eukprot:UN22455
MLRKVKNLHFEEIKLKMWLEYSDKTSQNLPKLVQKCVKFSILTYSMDKTKTYSTSLHSSKFPSQTV